MSAINVTQEEADLILVGLNMYADVQRNASGSVPDDVKALITKITPAPAAPVVEVVVESAPVVEAVAEPEVVVETPVAKAKADEQK
jgi:hypothetical protein